MARRKKGFGIFISTFCISFVILSALFLLFMLYTRTAKVETVKPDVPAGHIPTTDENMNLLMLFCREPADPPGLVVIASYHAPQGELSLVFMPPEALCMQGSREDTIEGWYQYEGVRGGFNSVQELLGVEIQRYVRTDGDGLTDLIDFLGGVEYELPNDFEIGGETFWAGYQLLDGRRMKTLLFAPDAFGAANVDLQRELGTLLLEKRFDESFADNYDRFTATLFDCCETNLSQYDFLTRREGFSDHLRNGTLHIQSIQLEGKYSETHTKFTPDPESLRTIQEMLSGNKP